MKCYLVTLPERGKDWAYRPASLGIMGVKDKPFLLEKTMFELSRDTDIGEGCVKFDASIHTLDAIKAGIPGHVPLVCREYDDADLPTDRYFRNAWEWSD